MIEFDMVKVKEKGHKDRRLIRTEKFLPVDGDSQYAVLSDEGQTKRADIKARDDAAQIAIDQATSKDDVKAIVEQLKV